MQKTIIYFTRRDLSEKVAQSHQICKMSRAFDRKLGNYFGLIATNATSISDIKSTQNLAAKSKINTKTIISFVCRCIITVIQERPDWIYTRDILVVLICFILCQRVCIEIHHPHYRRTSRLLFRALCGKKTMKVVAISNSMKSYLETNYKIESDRILVAHDACDGTLVDADLQIFGKYGIPKYQHYTVHAGSFNADRGAEEIINLAKQNPLVAFIQVGGNVVDINKYKAKTIDIYNMFYIPNLDSSDLKVLLATADLLLFPMNKKNPIWWCTSPMKIFDYLESGTPIIGSCVGSTSEILKPEMFIEYKQQDIYDANIKLKYAIQNLSKLRLKAAEFSSIIRKQETWEKRAEKVFVFLNVTTS